MVFKNEFSWSKSRDGLFNECKRKYFFNHYGFWNGWIASEDDRVKQIYYLKKLATKELWMGSVVHGVIEFVLKRFRAGEEIGLNHALVILKKRMESDFAMSKLGGYTGFNSKAHRFFEDEYGIEISGEAKKDLFDKAELCLRNFFNSDIFMDIRNTPIEDWVTLEDFLSFEFNGTRVYLSIDFAMKKGFASGHDSSPIKSPSRSPFRDDPAGPDDLGGPDDPVGPSEPNKIVLYDWKTGGERKSDYELQLSLYALYIAEKFGIMPENIEAKMFYLAIDKVDDFYIDSNKLEETKSYISASILEMKKLLSDIGDNEAIEEKFCKTEGYWCSRCSFRKVCFKEFEKI